MKLTKPQLTELKQLAKKPQSTFGSSRVRLQNTLVRLRLASYEDEEGKPTDSWSADRCVITDKGRTHLTELEA